MRLIDADTAAAFAENCGATFVAKRLRDGNAFPEVVVRCKDCKYNIGAKKCLNPDSFFAVPKDDDFCSYGEREWTEVNNEKNPRR